MQIYMVYKDFSVFSPYLFASIVVGRYMKKEKPDSVLLASLCPNREGHDEGSFNQSFSVRDAIFIPL